MTHAPRGLDLSNLIAKGFLGGEEMEVASLSSVRSPFRFQENLLQRGEVQTSPLRAFPRRYLKFVSAAMATSDMQVAQLPQQMKLLFVEMGVGYDQHGQDITAAAMRACKDAISSNSIPAFRGAIPGVSTEHMKLKLKLGVPRACQDGLNLEKVKSVFPYGKIVDVEVVDGGLVCSSGVVIEAMGDKNDQCFVVNAAVYVGY